MLNLGAMGQRAEPGIYSVHIHLFHPVVKFSYYKNVKRGLSDVAC